MLSVSYRGQWNSVHLNGFISLRRDIGILLLVFLAPIYFDATNILFCIAFYKYSLNDNT